LAFNIQVKSFVVETKGNGIHVNVGNALRVWVLNPLDVSEEDTKNLSDSLRKLSGAADQISKMAD
jgi:hypothetical protein